MRQKLLFQVLNLLFQLLNSMKQLRKNCLRNWKTTEEALWNQKQKKRLEGSWFVWRTGELHCISTIQWDISSVQSYIVKGKTCRFSTLFNRDADSMPRVWTGKEDIKAITKTACSAIGQMSVLYIWNINGLYCSSWKLFSILLQSMKLLATLAAIRLDEAVGNHLIHVPPVRGRR